MATWDIHKGEDKVCPQCESVYSVTHHQVPVKDIDSANCLLCGFELASWKSTSYPTYVLKVRGKWPRPGLAAGN